MTAPPMPTPAGFAGAADNLNDPTQDIVQQAVAIVLHQQAAPSPANQIVKPRPPEFAIDLGPDEVKKRLAAALYGPDFPPINADPKNPNSITDFEWCSWVSGRWTAHRGAVEKHLWLMERNRLFRAGQQWVSSNATSRGRGPWREPMKPADTARTVYNMIDKALDQRLQVLADQRPGFIVEPSTQDPEDKSQAEARQLALEDQYDKQNMSAVSAEASFWAQTDGVSFLHVFWDPDAGPWDESMGTPDRKRPLGDLTTEVVRCESVRVSANASRTRKPYYVIIREILPVTETAYLYGIAGVSPTSDQATAMTGAPGTDGGMNRWVLDQTTVGEGDRLRDQDVVERFTMYVEPQPDLLPDGLQIVTLGDHVVSMTPLLFKVLPVIPVRDGSTDPSYFPRPIMEQWIDHQMRVNALVSAIVDSIRVNKSGRFIARPGAIQQETFLGGGTNVLEVNGAIGSLDDIIKPVDGFSIGPDTENQLDREIKAFENASGWNDQSRGQISGDASGRAILAAREQLERVFAPPVSALADGLTDWAKVVIAGMAFGYDMPRSLGSVGNSRPDLAKGLTKDMFDGPCTAKVDKETLMPVPRVYREFRLDDLLAKGILNQQQYARRMKFGFIGDLDTPDEDQEARAKRIVAAILNQQPVPEMRWQDNEAIHQDVLERDIILNDDKPPQIIMAAQQRWTELANQAQMKAGGMTGPPGIQNPAGPSGPLGGASAVSGPSAPGPLTQPLPQSSPSLAIPMGGSQQDDAARQFEGMAPQ
jgi:hypothetical protein